MTSSPLDNHQALSDAQVRAMKQDFTNLFRCHGVTLPRRFGQVVIEVKGGEVTSFTGVTKH